MDAETRAALQLLVDAFSQKDDDTEQEPEAHAAGLLLAHFAVRLDLFFEDVHAIAQNLRPREVHFRPSAYTPPAVASGADLDAWGSLFRRPRRDLETDEAYRARLLDLITQVSDD